MGKESIKLIANNKKAYHDYFIEDTYEAGISLAGTEVKSMRMGKCSLKESFIKDEKGEAGEVYSISAGLDYPSVGPELAELKDAGRAEYVSITDEEALQAFYALSRNEGILPALESSHALAHAMKLAPTMDKDAIILVNLSGRGDKDVAQVADLVNSGAFVPAGD